MRRITIFLCLAGCLLAQGGNILEQADTAFRAGDLERAAALASKALAAEPGSVHAHMILGVIAAQRTEWDAATKHFEAVVRVEPSNPYGYFYLGQANLYQQKWEKAAQLFLKAQRARYPDQERLMVELAMAQNESGHPQDALASLAKISAPREGPLAAQYYGITALAKAKLNQPGPALEAGRRAREIDDSNPDYWGFLVSTLIGTNQTNQALMEAIRAQAKFPDHPDIQFLFSLASYYVTHSPLTKLALRNLREAEPDSARVLLVQGLLHRKQGRTEEATRAFIQAAKRGVPDAHLLLGIIYKENGDYEAAQREYREAERANPQNGQLLLEMGKLLLAQGDTKAALARLQKAAEYMPGASAVHYQLGLVYGRLGEKEKAEQHLSLSRKLDREQAELPHQP